MALGLATSERHRPFDGYLMVSDLDGTLLDSRHGISEQNIHAIYTFIKGGGKFALATGRGRISVWPYLSKIPVNAPCILYNGALIYDSIQGAFIRRCGFDDGIIPILESMHANHPDLGIEIFLEDSVLFYNENEWTQFHQNRDGFSARVIDSLHMEEPWYKIVLTLDSEKLRTVEQFYRDQMTDYCFNFSEPHFLDITHRNASKGAALHYLSGELKIRQDQTIAIGDNYNDLDMIREAGTGFAVVNACEELKREAQAICKSNEEHAIRDVVGRILNWIELRIV